MSIIPQPNKINQLKSLLLLAVIWLAWGCKTGHSQGPYARSILEERKEKDASLKSPDDSPLQEADRLHFHGLAYFEVDTNWRKTAVFSLINQGDTLDFQTTSGRVKQFYAFGTYRFHNGQREDTLIGYVRVYPEGDTHSHEPYVFLPFRDETTGDQTYGGGRYLDLDVPTSEGEVVIDFNRCYNPYCAYGDGFSCPIPPRENYINARVEAGEKDYVHH